MKVAKKRKDRWGEWHPIPKMQWRDMKDVLTQINEVLENKAYLVYVSDFTTDLGEMTHLWIHSKDRKARHSWHDFQRIKNEICGEHRVAVEVYPAQDDLIDQSNWYHLWVYPEGYSLSFGLQHGGQ